MGGSLIKEEIFFHPYFQSSQPGEIHQGLDFPIYQLSLDCRETENRFISTELQKIIFPNYVHVNTLLSWF